MPRYGSGVLLHSTRNVPLVPQIRYVMSIATPLQPNSAAAVPPPAAKTNVRHSEKPRGASTCRFADDVAQAVLATFRHLCPPDVVDGLQQTVVAGFVLCDENHPALASTSPGSVDCGDASGVHDGGGGNGDASASPVAPWLTVLSVGVGTKYMSRVAIEADRRENGGASGCRRVHDMHAEVLARRGLQRVLAGELLRCAAARQNASPPPLITFLESVCDGPAALPRYRLQPRFTLHMYTSSAPCGNACIKAWGIGSRPALARTVGQQPPTHNDLAGGAHPRLHIAARDDGQVAVLHKKPHIAMAPDDEDNSTSGEQTNAKRYRAEADQSAPAPSACVYKNVPAGTEPPPSSLSADITAARTHLPSCSDKMAKWNVLGLQGRLLTPFFSNRVVVSTIAVGRKFSAPHCARAVCCRLQDLPEGGSVDRKKQRRKLLRGEQAQTVESSSVACLAVHHPVLLSTATKLDESVRDQADAANFTERRCFAAFVDGAAVDGAAGAGGSVPSMYHCEVLLDGDRVSCNDPQAGARELSQLSQHSLWELMKSLLLPGSDIGAHGDVSYAGAKEAVLAGCDPAWIETRRRLFGTPEDFLWLYR
jgi:hypothetical protein